MSSRLAAASPRDMEVFSLQAGGKESWEVKHWYLKAGRVPRAAC